MSVEVRIQPNRTVNRKVQREIKRLAKKIGDLRVANRQVSVWLLRWVNDNFRSQGGKVGGWAPFKFGGRKIKGGGIDTSAQLLQDTGKLRASFKNFYSRTFAGVGSELDRSLWHELGVPQHNLPARRMLPEARDAEVSKAILKIYDAHIKRAIK